jgi:hypothetical protein
MQQATEDRTEKAPEGHAARSLPFGGGCAVLLGGVFAALAGLFAAAIAAVLVLGGEIPRDQRILVPPVILFVFIIGLGLMWTGRRDWQRARRGKEQAALHPGEAWHSDWAWDPAGVDADSEWGGGTGLLVMLFILLVMAPFNVLWLYAFDDKQETAVRLFSLMVLIPDFFMFLLLRGIGTIVRNRLRFGRPRLLFEGFPFFLGRSFRARLSAKAFEGKEGVSATLRCIDERIMTTRTTMRGSALRQRSTSVRPYQLYEARRTFEGPFLGEEMALTFALPEDAPTTHLLRQPPRYWELEVRRGSDSFTFLVPVYARA